MPFRRNHSLAYGMEHGQTSKCRNKHKISWNKQDVAVIHPENGRMGRSKMVHLKQASNKGWKIIKGSKGTPVEFWSLYDTQKKKKISYAEARELEKNLTPEEYDKRIRLVSRVYSVFNAEQIDGISKYEAKSMTLTRKE